MLWASERPRIRRCSPRSGDQRREAKPGHMLTNCYLPTAHSVHQHKMEPSRTSNAEVLCLGLAAQWQTGVPWHSERAFVRYALRHLRPLFPGMTSQSAFNRRVRRLWGAFLLLQQAVVLALEGQHICEIIDCVPVRVARGVRSFQPRRLADIARRGKGGTDRFFYGLHLLLAVTPGGFVSGWTLLRLSSMRMDDDLRSARMGGKWWPCGRGSGAAGWWFGSVRREVQILSR
jgi:hypothetical protein